MNIFLELQKKGYQITNKRVLGNPSYTSDETRRKDLIQELALVVDWLDSKNLHLQIRYEGEKNTFFIWVWEYDINLENNDYKTPQEATIAAIEYLIENKLI